MLPIVEGCRAIIIKSFAKNAGLEVVVVKKLGLGKIGNQPVGETWEIYPPLNSVSRGLRNRVYEYQLMRIDGGDFSKEHERITEKEGA